MRSYNWCRRLPAASVLGLSLSLTGCGGSSNVDEPVVDLDDPAFQGPGMLAPPVAQAPPQQAPPQQAPGGGLGGIQPRGAADAPEASPEPDQAEGSSFAQAQNMGSGSAAMNEMFQAAGSTASSASNEQQAGPEGPGGGPGQAGGQMEAMMMQGGGGYGPPGGPGSEGYPGMGGQEYEQQMAMQQEMAMQQGGYGPPGGAGGYPGMEAGGFGPDFQGGYPGQGGGQASGPGATEPGDFTSPRKAVESFLNAAQARNARGLAEATALRAPQEATARNREVFQAILEEALDSEALEQLAASFDDYQIQGQNQMKSTGSLGIIIGKQADSGSQLTRTIEVRREKAGWKVRDVSGVREQKQLGQNLMRKRNQNQNRP